MMAQWKATRTKDLGWRMNYYNHADDTDFLCGEANSHTSIDMVLQFILADASGGDLVFVDGLLPFIIPFKKVTA